MGVEHFAKSESSRLHSNWSISRPSVPTPSVSLPSNVNDIELNRILLLLATMSSLTSTALAMDVLGGTVSTAQLIDAGVGLRLPTSSSDIMSTVWTPSLKFVIPSGLVQSINSELSILHSKPFTPTPMPSLPALLSSRIY